MNKKQRERKKKYNICAYKAYQTYISPLPRSTQTISSYSEEIETKHKEREKNEKKSKKEEVSYGHWP